MVDLTQLKTEAQTIKNAIVVGENTANRVGTLFEEIVNEEEIRPSVEDTSNGDFEICDESYNAVARFVNGGVRTKKFNSENVPYTNDSQNEDFGIYDENYNEVLRLVNGGVKTLKFDSSKTPWCDNNTDAVFEISDENGNVIFRIDGGVKNSKTFVGSPQIYTPTFIDSSPSLLGGVTDVYDAYEALHTSYPMLFSAGEVIGRDASNTYDVKHWVLGYQFPRISTDRDASDPNLWSDSVYKRGRLLVTSGCHPTEQPSILGCYQAISEILSSDEPWAMFIKNNFVLDIVPLINPWGLAQSPVTDNNANGKNVNRTYYSDIQQENTNIMNLISSLLPKGLVGVIDCHNGAWYDNDGYFVSKPAYKNWNFYCVLSQQLSATSNYLFEQAFGTTKNHFHMWDASANSGQLHEYANNLGLFGCTFELRNKLTYGGALFTKGAQITKMLLINIINSFLSIS